MASIFPILIAAAVALAVVGVASLVKGLMSAEKRKLQQRLSGENQQRTSDSTSSALPLSITRDIDLHGASALLVRWRPMESLHRLVVQAYPNSTVSIFLTI